MPSGVPLVQSQDRGSTGPPARFLVIRLSCSASQVPGMHVHMHAHERRASYTACLCSQSLLPAQPRGGARSRAWGQRGRWASVLIQMVQLDKQNQKAALMAPTPYTGWGIGSFQLFAQAEASESMLIPLPKHLPRHSPPPGWPPQVQPGRPISPASPLPTRALEDAPSPLPHRQFSIL